MCLICYKPAENPFPSDYIIAARHLENRDGAGVMYATGDRVIVRKTIGNDDDVRAMYEESEEFTLAFHVRHQTLGPIDLANCHPFWVTNKDWGDKFDIAMMHNGTIHDVQVDFSLSDSSNFATYFMRPVLEKTPTLYKSGEFWNLVSALIGKNKLVFLDNTGRFIIVNSALGRILEPFGVWISKDVTLSPPGNKTAQSRSVPVTQASRALPKGVYYDGYWVGDVDGNHHFRAGLPKITLEGLIGSNREDIFNLVKTFPSLATDFLMAILETRNAE